MEEQEALLGNASMDSVNFDAEGIPEGFRRLHSPRQGKAPPEAALARVQVRAVLRRPVSISLRGDVVLAHSNPAVQPWQQ